MSSRARFGLGRRRNEVLTFSSLVVTRRGPHGAPPGSAATLLELERAALQDATRAQGARNGGRNTAMVGNEALGKRSAKRRLDLALLLEPAVVADDTRELGALLARLCLRAGRRPVVVAAALCKRDIRVHPDARLARPAGGAGEGAAQRAIAEDRARVLPDRGRSDLAREHHGEPTMDEAPRAGFHDISSCRDQET